MIENGLLGVTYSQFDNREGTKLLYSYPQDIIEQDDFVNLSDFVIVGKNLCEKIIIVKTDDFQFLNFSVAIDNVKYERNALLFSFGFVLTVDAETEPFENVLRKLSKIFVSLELESEFLFKEETRSRIQIILKTVFLQLQREGCAFLEIDSNNVLSIKLLDSPGQPVEVEDFSVPILCADKATLLKLPWDIAICRILGVIDGTTSVKKIANKSTHPGMDVGVVKKSLRTLIHYDCVILSDILRFTNIYTLTENAQSLFSATSSFLADAAAFCQVNGANVSPLKLLKLFCRFRPGKTLAAVIAEAPSSLQGVHLRKLLAFAQSRNALRRMHEYPVDLTGRGYPIPLLRISHHQTQVYPPKKAAALHSLKKESNIALVGSEHMDALFTSHGLSMTAKDLVLERPHVCIVYK